jgi:predicted outer membrane repeat protein
MKKRIFIFWFIAILILFLNISSIYAATIYVNASATGSNNGTSWTDAYTSFQTALDNAVSDDQIWVAKGTYKPSTEVGGTGDRFKTFQMKNGVEIYGGFAGTETSIDQRTEFNDGETNETILSGDLNGNDDFDVSNGGYLDGTGDDNCYHVFYHPSGTNLDNSAILDGFTITGGNANAASPPDNQGGGIFNKESSPTLSKIIIKDNNAESDGGGMLGDNSASLITNSVFYSNRSGALGGALIDWNATSVTLINCLFYQNYSNSGGAVYAFNAKPTLTNVTISNNAATNGGGLSFIFSNSNITLLNNCIIWGNTATSEGNQLYISSSGKITMNYSCYSNSTNDIQNNGGTFTATNNNMNSDPEFANSASNDFRLFSNSPAINTGSNAYNAHATDIRGQSRIQDGTIDMGSYEWTSGVDPQIIFVHAAATCSNKGSSWTDAFTDLQNALSAASSGDQIWVATGTYKPSIEIGGTGSRYQTFQLKNDVSVYGGFAGTESSIEERTSFGSEETNETILSGDIGVIGDSTDNCYHVIYNWNNGNNSLLDGFTVKLGNASGVMTTFMGGGLHFNNVSGRLQNMTFESNYAVIGGGIILQNSTITLNNVVFKNNCATSGAGIYCSASSANLNNTSFSKNSAANDGGAMYIYGASNITMNNSILWGNQASGDGNEIYIQAGTVDLNHSCYSNNSGDIDNSGTFNPSNCIVSNPLFVNSSTDDLWIYGNSPCVNSGSNSYNSLSTDIRGEVRIQNTTIDMGAYEWTAGTDPAYRVLYVNAIASGSNNGSSWTNAYTSLQSALNEAVYGDQIWVAKGTYKPSSAYDLTNTSRYYHFRLVEGVEIYGGFVGTETDVSERTNYGVNEANETILSGDLSSNDNFDVTNGGYQTTTGDDNCYHVFYHPDGMNLTSAAVLDGFTVSGGNATDPAGNPHYRAGGFYAFSSSPSIKNVVFKSNSANHIGGAVYIYNSTSDFTNVSFIKNKSFSSGGGIYVRDGSPTLNQIYCDQNYSENGGAFYAYTTNPNINQAIFTNNHSTSDGGALSTHSSSIDITNALFADNVCSQNGGALELYSGSTELTSTLNNVTITNNAASGIGGGINFQSSASSSLVLNNSIVYGNNATTNGNEIASNSYDGTTLNYSCYDNNTNDVLVSNGTFVSTNNNITTDPSFANPALSDYRLIQSSPAVDTGNNSYNSLTTDIRGMGYPRKLNKLSLDPGTIDMGAYEYNVVEDSTLPVGLSAFTAQFFENIPTLYWSTESETDNMGWFVYRADENDFTASEKISDFIEGHGTTTQQQSYIYEDTIQEPEVGDTLYYWLESIDYSGQVNHYDKVVVLTIPDHDDPGQGLIPESIEYGLFQNIPNPVISSTKIAFNLKEVAKIDLTIYNLKGQLVKKLFSGVASTKTVEWDGKDELGKELTPGVYFYNLIVNGKTAETKKLIFMK